MGADIWARVVAGLVVTATWAMEEGKAEWMAEVRAEVAAGLGMEVEVTTARVAAWAAMASEEVVNATGRP